MSLLDLQTTLWMGDLEPWMDETFIKSIWFQYGELVDVKLIKDKISLMNAGYCFVDFTHHAAADAFLNSINGSIIPGTARTFKLNWAAGTGLNDGGWRAPEYTVFVGDLDPDVTDAMLLQYFALRYQSIKHAGVVKDPMTGVTRCYGFIRFLELSDQKRAIKECHGQWLGNKQMLVSTSTPKPKLLGDISTHTATIPLIVAPQPKSKIPKPGSHKPASESEILFQAGGFNLGNARRFGSMHQYHIQPIEPLDSVDVAKLNAEYIRQHTEHLERIVKDSIAANF